MKAAQRPAPPADSFLTRPCPLHGRPVAIACSRAPLRAMQLLMPPPPHQSYPLTWQTRIRPDPPGRGPPEALMQLLGGLGPQSPLAGLRLSVVTSWQALTAWLRDECSPQGMIGKVCTGVVSKSMCMIRAFDRQVHCCHCIGTILPSSRFCQPAGWPAPLHTFQTDPCNDLPQNVCKYVEFLDDGTWLLPI